MTDPFPSNEWDTPSDSKPKHKFQLWIYSGLICRTVSGSDGESIFEVIEVRPLSDNSSAPQSGPVNEFMPALQTLPIRESKRANKLEPDSGSEPMLEAPLGYSSEFRSTPAVEPKSDPVSTPRALHARLSSDTEPTPPFTPPNAFELGDQSSPWVKPQPIDDFFPEEEFGLEPPFVEDSDTGETYNLEHCEPARADGERHSEVIDPPKNFEDPTVVDKILDAPNMSGVDWWHFAAVGRYWHGVVSQKGYKLELLRSLFGNTRFWLRVFRLNLEIPGKRLRILEAIPYYDSVRVLTWASSRGPIRETPIQYLRLVSPNSFCAIIPNRAWFTRDLEISCHIPSIVVQIQVPRCPPKWRQQAAYDDALISYLSRQIRMVSELRSGRFNPDLGDGTGMNTNTQLDIHNDWLGNAAAWGLFDDNHQLCRAHRVEFYCTLAETTRRLGIQQSSIVLSVDNRTPFGWDRVVEDALEMGLDILVFQTV